MVSYSVLAIVACIVVSASAQYKKSATLCFDRDLKANVCGKVKFGPCGRPKSNVNANFKDCGRTNVGGNVFQVLETAGRLGETLKLVGNRFKPYANCPPRPPSNNNDLSSETLCDGAIRNEVKRPCYRVKHVGGGGKGRRGGRGGRGCGNRGGYGNGGFGNGGFGHGGYGNGGCGYGNGNHHGNGHHGTKHCGC